MKSEALVPGIRVRGSKTGRPIMAAFDLLGRRGTLRLIWELREKRSMTFRSLQEATELSPATLNARLKDLRGAGLLDSESGYRLTKLGNALLPALEPLHEWAVDWGTAHGKRRKK